VLSSPKYKPLFPPPTPQFLMFPRFCPWWTRLLRSHCIPETPLIMQPSPPAPTHEVLYPAFRTLPEPLPHCWSLPAGLLALFSPDVRAILPGIPVNWLLWTCFFFRWSNHLVLLTFLFSFARVSCVSIYKLHKRQLTFFS